MHHLLDVRPAQEQDSEAVQLIYSAGPKAFDYGFSLGEQRASDFLDFAFKQGEGFFGWRNHIVVISKEQAVIRNISLNKDEVVGIGAFYSGHEYRRLSWGLVLQVLHFYRSTITPRVLWRGLQLKALMPPPAHDMHYAANLGVRPELQGLGIGTFLLNQQEAVARSLGRKSYALDVFVDNPRAQQLYERIGFALAGEQHFSGPVGQISDSRRLEKNISS